MDTVLNVGLNDSIVHALAATSKCPKFAYDTYRRFLQLYGTNVNGIDPSKFTEVLERVFEDRNLSDESQLTTFDLQKIVQDFKILAEAPEDPYQQIFRIVEAIYCSWESSSATQYRSLRGVSDVRKIFIYKFSSNSNYNFKIYAIFIDKWSCSNYSIHGVWK